MVQKILGGVALLVLAFVVFVATRPSTYHVERSIDVSAPADVVFAQLDDFHAWAGWSPWEKLDSSIEKTYDGPARTVGSSYTWKGNSRVGAGKMTVQSLEPGKHLGLQVDFIVPFKSTVATDFTLAPKDGSGGDAVTLTWATDGQSTFMGKLFGLMISMDEILGPDYDKGLKALKELAEAEAVKQKAAAAEAAAAQAAAAQAAAAQAAAAQATAAQAAPQQH